MIKNLILIALFIVFSIAYIRFLEWRTIFYPMRQIETTPKAIGLDYEDLYFRTEDGKLLNGWLIKNPAATSTVILFHGNAGNISHRLDKIAFFHKLGLNVFIIDYRGYGKSQGRPGEKGLYLDARAAYDYLSTRKDLGKKKIACGESLGCAAAIDLCLNRKLDGLILDSAFASARDMSRVVFPFLPTFLIMSKFDSIEKIKSIKIPKLFIHSINDEIVPFSQGAKLFQAAPEPKEFLKIMGGHNSGFFETEDLIREKTKSFLAEYDL
jgi:fermentation-respiration switch protein FrsA (DUF1100 family)